MPEQVERPKPKHHQRFAARRKSLPRGPDEVARDWKPPFVRKDTPPAPVPHEVRCDKRQVPLELETQQ
jgi:hypothetical protein